MSATLTHHGLPEGITRNDFRRTVKTACRHVLQLPELAVAVIEQFFDHTQDVDFEAGRICGAWMSARNLAALLGKSERRICETEKSLEDAGLILRTNGNDSRAGERRGTIRWLRGINLAPLIDKATDIISPVEAWERAQSELNSSIRQARNEIRRQRQCIREAQNVQALADADAVSNGGRTSRIGDIDRLIEMSEALQAIIDTIEESSGARESAHLSATNRAPNTNSESNSESCRAESSQIARQPAVTLRQALAVATPEFVDCFAVQSRAGWPGLADAARLIAASTLDINQRTWGTMCDRWGPEVAALSVILIDRHRRLPEKHPWRVKQNAGGCFVGLMRNPRNLIRMLKASQNLPPELIADQPPCKRELTEDDGRRLGEVLPQIAARSQEEARHGVD